MIMKNEILYIEKRPKLTKSQTILYTLILKKIDSGDPITFLEAKDIYVNHACREVRNGVPQVYNCWWKNEKDEIVGRYQDMSDYEVTTRTMLWLTQNIGSLVLKGCLKVIPQIEISELKNLIK